MPDRARRRSAFRRLAARAVAESGFLMLLRLVEDRVAQVELREELLVAAEERVARDDDVGVLELVVPLLAVAAVPDACRSEGANLSISRSQLVTTLVGATMSALNGFLPLGLLVLAFTARSSASAWTVLPSPMSSARTPPRADLVQEPEPVEALLLVGAEGGLEVARLLRPLDLVDVAQLLEELLGAVGDVRSPTCSRSSCTRPACESGSLPPCPPPVARISAWRRSTSRTFCGVEPGEGAVREADVASPFGEAAGELVLRDRDPFALEREAEREPVDAARDARVGALSASPRT